MKKYEAPIMEFEKAETSDVITTSGVTIQFLSGIDTGDDRSAIIDASRFLNM